MSLTEYSTLYFHHHARAVDGLEPASELLLRLNRTTADRQILAAGSEKARQAASCLLFRNQLFIGSLMASSGEAGAKVKASAQAVELAYQTNEDEFLAVCERELHTEVGIVFLQAQTRLVRTN